METIKKLEYMIPAQEILDKYGIKEKKEDVSIFYSTIRNALIVEAKEVGGERK